MKKYVPLYEDIENEFPTEFTDKDMFPDTRRIHCRVCDLAWIETTQKGDVEYTCEDCGDDMANAGFARDIVDNTDHHKVTRMSDGETVWNINENPVVENEKFPAQFTKEDYNEKTVVAGYEFDTKTVFDSDTLHNVFMNTFQNRKLKANSFGIKKISAVFSKIEFYMENPNANDSTNLLENRHSILKFAGHFHRHPGYYKISFNGDETQCQFVKTSDPI